MRTRITLLDRSRIGEKITVKGWVRTVREQKHLVFFTVNDGSNLPGLQVVAEEKVEGLGTGAAVAVEGELVESPAKGQVFELRAERIEVIGPAAEDYPLQKKNHSFEFLRTISHLRARTNTFGAIARLRSALAYATHTFFQERGFLFLQSPIITCSDCEGAGELFRVSTTKGEAEEFFGKPAYLTVSGQLNAESYALALSDVYTFGPTFRAENSHTARHLAEFWMMEPEMAFAGLEDIMDNAEEYLKWVIGYALEHCKGDLSLFDKFIDKGLIARLEGVRDGQFVRLPYTEAIEILQQSGKEFVFPVEWGADLQTEHERYLAEEHFANPVIVYDYPAEIKAFYMRANEDGKTVAAMDVLVPKVGEIVGGSAREERLERLEEKMRAQELDPEEYGWYLDLRRYGSVPHAGYGVGFERLVGYITGMENIRDVAAFPRTPGNAEP